MTSISQNMQKNWATQLKRYHRKNSTYLEAIKKNPVDEKSKKYVRFSTENNYKDPKSKVDDYVKISKYKSIFAKGYVPN